VPVDLSPQRRACLDRLLADIQNRSRLVRMVERETSEKGRSILAEVDLSGAPRFAVSLLLRIGLDAVRHVVSQNISAAELLADPAVTSTVWEFPLAQVNPAEGSQP
jgi:NAD(P)H-hydrate repair Nnr-like enzyme with NAD(P)H-hydrate dehydratase domain